MTTINALSNSYKGLSRQIITTVKIENPITGKSIKTNAIWDTGATNTVITAKVSTELELLSIGKTLVTGVHGIKEVNRYIVKATLNNENVQIDCPVTECQSLSPDDSICVLIGMDIINLGDFAISNFQGKTVMSFRVPSIQKIDFVEAIQHSTPFIKGKKTLPNDPCPCGSGKKYKFCCRHK